MGNMFEKFAADREAEQKKIEKTVLVADAAPAVEEKRTTLSLSLTVSDKKKLKMMAMEQDTTIAALIHGWIAEHSEEVGRRREAHNSLAVADRER